MLSEMFYLGKEFREHCEVAYNVNCDFKQREPSLSLLTGIHKCMHANARDTLNVGREVLLKF